MMRSVPSPSLFVFVALCALLVTACSPPSTPKQAAPAGAPTATAAAAADPAEHPESATPVTTDSLADAIITYVESETARQGGAFNVNDPEQKASLALTLTAVHRERVSRLEDGQYFACADFKGRDGHTYDVDVFMRPDANGLAATEVVVHKQNGTARYNWAEENGRWKKVPVTRP